MMTETQIKRLTAMKNHGTRYELIQSIGIGFASDSLLRT